MAEVKINTNATTNPSVNNDATENYSVGSFWYNISDERVFYCIDSSASSAEWREIIGVSGGATHITNSGNNVIFSTSNNQFGLRNNTSSGSDDGVATIGAAGQITSNRTGVLTIYGKNATANGDDVGGYIFLTAATANNAGRIWLESIVKTRKGILVNAGHDLVTGNEYSASKIEDPDGPLHVLGDYSSMGERDRFIPNFTASANANLLLLEQRGADNGMTIAVEDGNAIRLNFAHQNNAQAGGVVYDTSDDSFQFIVNGSEVSRILSSKIWLYGKTTSDIKDIGVEINSAGTVTASRANNAPLRLNRKSSEGEIADIRYNDETIASLDVDSGESRFKINKVSFDNGTTYLDHYAEGDFTPTLYGSSTAGTPTYSYNGGHYVRIGKQVPCTFRITLSNKSIMSGQVRIADLPFNVKNDANERPVPNLIVKNYSGIAGDIVAGYGVGNKNEVYLINLDHSDNFSEASLFASNIENDFEVRGTFTYITD